MPVTSRWTALSPRRRRTVVAAGTVLVLAVPGVAVLDARAEQRRLDDALAFTATVAASSRSTAPSGGRVDFFVGVRNTGPRAVQVDDVALVAPRLRVRARWDGPEQLQPGDSVGVPVSVLLDCRGVSAPLRGTVTARPASGRARAVAADVTELAPLTRIADTVCFGDPEAVGRELSGPIVQGRPS